MKERRKKRWEKIKAKGKKRYIWMYGVLRWGGSTGLLVYLYQYLIENRHHWLMDFIGTMITFGIGGYLWGLTMWKFFERQNISEN